MTNTAKSRPSVATVAQFIEATGVKKGFQAARWGITRFQMTALLYPGRYGFTLTAEQWQRIAADLNQNADDLRKFYERAA